MGHSQSKTLHQWGGSPLIMIIPTLYSRCQRRLHFHRPTEVLIIMSDPECIVVTHPNVRLLPSISCTVAMFVIQKIYAI